MNAKQEAKLKMFLALQAYLLANPEITARIPKFDDFIDELNKAILQIQGSNKELQYSSSGVTNKKKDLRELLINTTLDASGKMQALASNLKDQVLLAQTKFTITFLKDLSDLKLVDVTQGLYSLIDERELVEVSLYGLNNETQKAYKTAITDFNNSIIETRQTQLKKTENGMLETQGFDKGQEAVDNMDILVEVVHLSEPTFYAGYKNARKIIIKGTGTLQVQGLITDAATTLPVVNATLTFRLSGETEIATTKQSAAKGRFMIKSLTEGVYDVTISKTGYQTQTIIYDVTPDKLCNIEVGLIKNS